MKTGSVLDAQTLQRGLGVVAALAAAVLVLSIAVVPASAQAPEGTAELTAIDSFSAREVYANTPQQVFDVTVSNPLLPSEGTPATVNWVEIDPTSDFELLGGTGPGDWESDIRSAGGRVIFTGDTLGPGESATFTVTTEVGQPQFDVSLPWSVSASDDGGTTATGYEPSESGALSPTIRVLQVVDNRFTGPTFIDDGDATEGQSVDGVLTVANLGSGTVTVDPSLSGSGFASLDDPAAFDLAPDSAPREIAWSGTLNGPGNASVSADATGTTQAFGQSFESDAPVSQSTDALSVLSAAEFEYAADSLNPQIVVPGSSVAFSVQLDNIGQAAVDNIDLASSTFEFAGFSAPLTSPSSIEGDSSALFTFQDTVVPATIPDGDYTPTVTINGTDQNGVTVSQTITLDDTLTLDSTVPDVAIDVDLPTSAVNGESPAATSNTDFQVTGTVTDANDSGEQDPCGSCEITGQLVVFDASGTQIQQEPVQFTNDGGDLSATINTSFQSGATAANVTASAVDEAGLSNSGATEIFDVDIVAPGEDLAVTGGPDGSDLRRIDVHLTERVAFPDRLTPTNFDVDGNVVTGVEFVDSKGVDNNEASQQGNSFPVGDQIVLTLGQDLGEDETPAVRFNGADLGDRPYDRVNLTLGNFEIEAADGILPPLPAVDSLGGLGELDGQFHTNQSAPELVASNVTEGHRIQVYEDSDGDGAVDGTDREVGEKIAQSSGSITIQLDDLGTTERDLTLLTRAVDASGNEGETAADAVSLDFTAPEFATLGEDVDNREVNTTLDEPLRDGRNAVADWVVEKNRFGTYVALERDQVTGADNTDTRTTHISDDEEQWEEGAADRVSYDFDGPVEERYIDRAGNVLANFVHVAN